MCQNDLIFTFQKYMFRTSKDKAKKPQYDLPLLKTWMLFKLRVFVSFVKDFHEISEQSTSSMKYIKTI